MTSNLTRKDLSLLAQKTNLPKDLRQKLSSPTSTSPDLTDLEISTLSAATIKAYTTLNNPKTRKALKQVLTKLLATGEETHNSPHPGSTINKSAVKKAIQDLESTTPNWPNLSLGEKIQTLNQKLNYPTIDQTTEALEILIDHLNNQPRASFGNLSPRRVSSLINNDWTPDTPGIQFRHDLSPSEVTSTPIITRALVMLRALAVKETKATAACNLSRKFVASMIDRMELPDDYLDYLHRYNKVLNESDVPPVEIIRIVLELANTIEFKKQKYQIAPMGRELMQPDYEGGLFLILFITFFREFNIGFGDRMGDWPEFQDNVAYSFYKLSILNDGWHDLAETSEQLVLPALTAKIPTEPFDFRTALVGWRFLVHLELFGLVELKRNKLSGIPMNMGRILEFRKTALFERFVMFKFSLKL